MRLATERLLIRDWDPDADAEAAFAMYSDPEVMRYLGRNPQVMTSVAAQRDRLAERVAEFKQRADGTGFWALEATEGVVGALLFKELPDADGAGTGDYEFGWHLARAAWGHGYATEGARALLPYIWGLPLDFDRLNAICYPENVASRRVMERLGMTHIGRTDRYYGVECELYVLDRP